MPVLRDPTKARYFLVTLFCHRLESITVYVSVEAAKEAFVSCRNKLDPEFEACAVFKGNDLTAVMEREPEWFRS